MGKCIDGMVWGEWVEMVLVNGEWGDGMGNDERCVEMGWEGKM